MAAGLLCAVFIFLKFCEICDSKLTSQFCTLENNNVGKCVPIAFCPQATNLSKSESDYLTKTCDSGTICCKVSAKIVTPVSGNPAPASAPASNVEWVSVTPVVVNPNPQQPNVGASPPSSGAAPPSGSNPPGGNGPPTGSGGATPPSGAPSGGSPPSGSPGGGPPSGVPGGGPPSGAPGGGPPSGAPGGGPPSGTPPNGASPPSGGSPPIMGSIVAEVPSRSLPPQGTTPSDTVVVSAEVIDNTIDSFDKKCDLYYSMLSSQRIPTNTRSQTPVVMIYGGTNSAEKEFPHMAALGFGDPNNKQWLCAGSLITENYVVSAAHCMSAPPLGEVRYAKMGSIRLDQDTPNTQQFNVIGRKVHEQYDPRSQYNDIALIQLDRPVQITEYVLPICLFSSTNYEDRNLIASGWGKTESGYVSTNLKKVGLELFSQAECQNAYSVVPKQQLPFGIQESTQVCAGSRTGGKDTCQGDSGGPLEIRKNNRWYLIGITSVGIQCGNANYPGVYTRIAYFLPWIQQNILNR